MKKCTIPRLPPREKIKKTVDLGRGENTPPFALLLSAARGTHNSLWRTDGKPLAYMVAFLVGFIIDWMAMPKQCSLLYWLQSRMSQRFILYFLCFPFCKFLGWIKIMVMIQFLNMKLGEILMCWEAKSDSKQVSGG